MNKPALLAILAMALLGAQAFASPKLSHADKKVIQTTAACNRADAQFGQLAIRNGVDPQVKAIGRKMLDDGAQMNTQVQRVAYEKNVKMPQQMTSDDQKLYDRLSKLSGDEFDRQFLQAMGERQKKALQAFQAATDNSRDPDVRQLAAQSMTTVRVHRNLAEDARQHL